MKVLVLTHSYPRFANDAAGNFVLRLARALHTEEGIESRVVAPAGAGCASAETLDGIDVRRFRYAPRSLETLAYHGTMAQEVAASWSAKFALVGMLSAHFAAAVRERRDFMPDLIHAHWWFPSGLVGTWAAKFSNLPLVITLHGSDVRLARTKAVGRSLGRSVLHSATAVTTVSNWLAEGARAIAPDLTPIVAHMPVDTSRFTADATHASTHASAHPSEHAPDHFVFVGRLNAQKGIADALRALALMTNRTATLDVIGDSPERDAYAQLARELGIEHRVHFHGHLPHDQLAAYYQRASALVMPSMDEGLGLTAVEALLCETPVIAYRSGGLPDIVREHETGFLIPPQDIAQLAHAMDAVVADPARAGQLGQAGRLFVLGSFSEQAAASRYASIYRDAIASHGR
jgi:glycosyltransferase involved in cell wall biosynthesis